MKSGNYSGDLEVALAKLGNSSEQDAVAQGDLQATATASQSPGAVFVNIPLGSPSKPAAAQALPELEASYQFWMFVLGFFTAGLFWIFGCIAGYIMRRRRPQTWDTLEKAYWKVNVVAGIIALVLYIGAGIIVGISALALTPKPGSPPGL